MSEEQQQPSGGEDENGAADDSVTSQTTNAFVAIDNNAGTDTATESTSESSAELQTTGYPQTAQTEQTPQTAQTLQTPNTAQTAQTEQTPQTPQTPEYGALKEPEYGALASQFPSDYDPYLYGRPEAPPLEEKPDGSGAQSAKHGLHAPGFLQAGGAQPQSNSQQQPGMSGQSSQLTPSGQPATAGQNAPGYQPRIVHGIDVNDPNQNPLYGRWDMYAIMSLAFAILMVPVLPTVMGAMAMWRTKTFHMRGFWLGLAAVIINVAMTLFSMWLMSRGITVDEVYDWLITHIQGNVPTDGTFSV